jgi:hypothetical protein
MNSRGEGRCASAVCLSERKKEENFHITYPYSQALRKLTSTYGGKAYKVIPWREKGLKGYIQ